MPSEPEPLNARLAEALDGVLPRMAFVKYGQFYNDDPDFDLEAYYLRVAESMIESHPDLFAARAVSPDLAAAMWTAADAYREMHPCDPDHLSRGCPADQALVIAMNNLRAALTPKPVPGEETPEP